MAMLAERRQKQKFTLNPRGKYWTEDSNKIGQKIMEKMGWTSGKGLGVNEQGNTKHCRLSYKNDTTGIGYNKNPEAWTEHQEKFEDFLQQLQGNLDENNVQKLKNKNDNLNEQSMELKSKQSRARVHYHKFIRGKDLNKYKSKDLANIFGRKELTDKIRVNIERNDNIYEKEAIGIKDNRHGVVTINSGNMTDYFKSKLNSKPMRDNSLTSKMTNNEAIDSKSENERAGFGFVLKENTLSTECRVLKDSCDKSNYAFDNPCLGLNSPVDSITDSTSTKSEKKRKRFENASLRFNETDRHNVQKKLKTEITDSNDKNAFTNPALNLDMESEENHNGKEFEVSRAEFGFENCGLDLTDEKSDKKQVTFSDHIMLYEYNKDSSKKKKKGEVTLDKFEVENKKHKKKRKHESITIPTSDGFINEALDVESLDDEINDNELNEFQSKKIKKRKIYKISSLETIQESPEQEKEINNIESEPQIITLENEKADIVDKKSKKKKKKKVQVEDIEIDIKNKKSDIEIIEEITRNEVKRDKNKEEEILTLKKCKKKKKKDKENCKNELKHTVRTKICSDKKSIDILEKSNMKQEQIDYSDGIEDKNAIKIETLSVVEAQEDNKRKKKKKNTDKEDCLKNEISICDVERDISDKENTDKDQDLDTKKSAKTNKKDKKSKDINVSDIADSSCNTEVADVSIIKKEIENAEFDTSSKSTETVDSVDDTIYSPSNAKAKISKRLLLALVRSNPKLFSSSFSNSNILDVKGYGC